MYLHSNNMWFLTIALLYSSAHAGRFHMSTEEGPGSCVVKELFLSERSWVGKRWAGAPDVHVRVTVSFKKSRIWCRMVARCPSGRGSKKRPVGPGTLKSPNAFVFCHFPSAFVWLGRKKSSTVSHLPILPDIILLLFSRGKFRMTAMEMHPH